MTRLHVALSTALLLSSATPMFAGPIPYPNPFHIAPEVPTYASSAGGIVLSYYGSTAGGEDAVQVYDVQTGFNSGNILDNRTTPVGTELTVGAGQINAGDQIIFYIDSIVGRFASIGSYSDDGVNHAYITDYPGGTLNSMAIPAGYFVGLEDLPNGATDFNYNDDTFVVSGVDAPAVSATPEPTSLALFATGMLVVAGLLRRRGESVL